jgi:SOS-response transcriptional repressor LexA
MLPTYHCQICGHDWHPRKEGLPKYCARCHSPRWNEAEGRKRPPVAEQRAAAKVRKIEEAAKTLRIPVTDELRQAALSTLNLFKGKNNPVRVGVTNAGHWNDMTDEQPEETTMFDMMEYNHSTDEFWRVNETEGNGLCLTGDDIFPGDIIHFRSGISPNNGDIVLAMGHDLSGRFFVTAKHWYEVGTRYGKPVVELRPSNPECSPIKAFEFNVEISGVAISAIRKGLRNRLPNGKIAADTSKRRHK